MLGGEIVTYVVAGAFVGWLVYQLARDMAANRRVVRGPVMRDSCADSAWSEQDVSRVREIGRLEDQFSLPSYRRRRG